jgi:hypothetical protein
LAHGGREGDRAAGIPLLMAIRARQRGRCKRFMIFRKSLKTWRLQLRRFGSCGQLRTGAPAAMKGHRLGKHLFRMA